MSEYEINEQMVEEIRKLLTDNKIFSDVTMYYNNKSVTEYGVEDDAHPETFLDWYNADMITITYTEGSPLQLILNGYRCGIEEEGCDDFEYKITSALEDIASNYSRQYDVFTDDSILFIPKEESILFIPEEDGLFNNQRDYDKYQTKVGKVKSERQYKKDLEVEEKLAEAYQAGTYKVIVNKK